MMLYFTCFVVISVYVWNVHTNSNNGSLAM